VDIYILIALILLNGVFAMSEIALVTARTNLPGTRSSLHFSISSLAQLAIPKPSNFPLPTYRTKGIFRPVKPAFYVDCDAF
jgi:hypothetical protein